MLRYRPDLTADHKPERRPPRSWVFLFESSGDRNPLLARTQVEIVRALLDNAEPGDTFNVLAASTQTRAYRKELRPITPQNTQAAITFLEDAHLIGALDLGRALAEAEPFLKMGKNATLVHVGGGEAGI